MKKIMYLVGALGLMFSSCTKNNDLDNLNSGNNAAVQFTAGVPTRVTAESDWEVDDRIGVFLGNMKNVQYKIADATSGKMEYISGGKILKDANTTYYAYYPYGTVTDDKLNIDLSTAQKPLVWAKAENQTGANVTLQFSHQLVKLNLTFKAGGRDIQDFNGATAKLRGANTKGVFNIKTGAWENQTKAYLPLEIASTKNRTTLTAYVMPNADLKNVEIEINAGGKIFAWKPSTAAWIAGNTYNYDIIVGAEILGSYIYSDGTYSFDYDNQKTCVGVIFLLRKPTTVADESQYDEFAGQPDGYIVSIDENEGKWSDEPLQGGDQSGNDKINGYKYTKIYNDKYNVNGTHGDKKLIAIPWCMSHTKLSATSKMTFSSWYMPSQQEYYGMHHNYTLLQAQLAKISTDKKFQNRFYFTSGLMNTNGYTFHILRIEDGDYYNGYKGNAYYTPNPYRAVCAFKFK